MPISLDPSVPQGEHGPPMTLGPPRVAPWDQPRATPLKNITIQILVLDDVAEMVFDLAVQAYSKTAWAVPHQRYAVRFRYDVYTASKRPPMQCR